MTSCKYKIINIDIHSLGDGSTLRVHWQCKKCGKLRTKLVRHPDWSLLWPKECEVTE